MFPYRPQPCNTRPANKAAWHSASPIYFPLYLLWPACCRATTTTTTLHPLCFSISWPKFLSGTGYHVYCVNDCPTACLNFEPAEGRVARSLCRLQGEESRRYRKCNRLEVNPFMIGIVKIPEKMKRQKNERQIVFSSSNKNGCSKWSNESVNFSYATWRKDGQREPSCFHPPSSVTPTPPTPICSEQVFVQAVPGDRSHLCRSDVRHLLYSGDLSRSPSLMRYLMERPFPRVPYRIHVH